MNTPIRSFFPTGQAEKHGLKKTFCCFNKDRICDGKGISVHQCKSVANSGVLCWVLKTQNINSVSSVVKYSGVRCVGSVFFYSFCFLNFDILFTRKRR